MPTLSYEFGLGMSKKIVHQTNRASAKWKRNMARPRAATVRERKSRNKLWFALVCCASLRPAPTWDCRSQQARQLSCGFYANKTKSCDYTRPTFYPFSPLFGLFYIFKNTKSIFIEIECINAIAMLARRSLPRVFFVLAFPSLFSPLLVANQRNNKSH